MTSTAASVLLVMPRDDVEDLADVEALGEGLRGGGLDDLAVHDRIRVRDADLDEVGAVLGQGDAGGDGVLDARVAGGQVADQGRPALGAGAVDGRCRLAGVRRRGPSFGRCSQLLPLFGDLGFG